MDVGTRDGGNLALVVLELVQLLVDSLLDLGSNGQLHVLEIDFFFEAEQMLLNVLDQISL